MPVACGSHRAYIYGMGGTDVLFELTPLSMVRWHRVRDDISTAEILVPTTECCDELGSLKTILHELHIERNGVRVWEGPITRIEYDWDVVRIFAADVLWQTTRRVIDTGYSQAYPNIGDALDRMGWLLWDQCYSREGDRWKMAGHLHAIRGPSDPRTSRVVNTYQFYVWEDFDKYAEDHGTDYTVTNRDVYFWDTHLAWKIIPPMTDEYLSQFPRIVEYGNQLATRGFVTNGRGQAGRADAPSPWPETYGSVDLLITNESDGDPDKPAPPEEIHEWEQVAANNIADRWPSPVSIVIPANTTLLPDAPWTIQDLTAGAWFQITTSHMCRTVTAWNRIHEVVVTEQAPGGETVQFTAFTAPGEMLFPPP